MRMPSIIDSTDLSLPTSGLALAGALGYGSSPTHCSVAGSVVGGAWHSPARTALVRCASSSVMALVASGAQACVQEVHGGSHLARHPISATLANPLIEAVDKMPLPAMDTK